MISTHHPTRRRTRRLALAGALVALLFVLAACAAPAAPTAPAAEVPAEPAATEAPAAEAPATEAPATEAPATEAPAEAAPTAEVAEEGVEEAVEAEAEAALPPTPLELEAAELPGPDPVQPSAADPAVELPAAAAQAPSGVVLPALGVNVRGGPGTTYPVLGIALQGTQGEIVGVSEDGQWWVASVPSAPDGRGWVAAAYVEASNADGVPVIPAPAAPAGGFVTAPAPAAAAAVTVPDEIAPAGTTGLIVFSASRVLREGNRAYDLEDIYTVSATPSSTPQLVLPNAMQPALQRSGQILAFRSTQSDQLGISAYDFGADARIRYTNHFEDSTPRWNPAGDQIVFSSNRTGDRRWHVYTMRPVPSDDRTGFNEVVDLGFGKDADWHPGQELIVFKGCDPSGQNCGLWTMAADGSGRARLSDGFNDSLPRWSPDGSSIVFMSDSRDGNWELYTLTAADGAVTRLTDDPAEDGLPVFSPDGSSVAFMSKRGGAWGIWTVPATGGAPQQIAGLEEQLPDWLLQGLEWPR